MTAIANLPDLRPSLLLDFANSGRVDPRIQCTRASAATCFGPDGKLRTVAANVPRINYGPATGKCLGLLVEEGRTNLLLNSGSFAAPAWGVNRSTLAASTVLAPDGSLAMKLSETADTGEHIIAQSITPAANTVYTFSVYVKAAERKYCILSVRNFLSQVAGANVRINLELGTYVAGSVPSGNTFKIEPAGDGWWRIILGTTTVAAPAVIVPTIVTAESESSYGHAGVVGYGIYLWGAQFEAGAFPTSYIPTEASAVTRALDAPYITPLASPWFSGSSGTVIVSYDYGAPNTANMVGLGLDDGTSSNVVSLASTAGDTDRFIVTSKGTGVFNTGFSPFTSGVRKTTGLTWGNRRISQSANGGSVSSVTDKDLPVGLNRITLGHSGYFGQSRSNGHVARLAYYSTHVTDSQLQRLTA